MLQKSTIFNNALSYRARAAIPMHLPVKGRYLALTHIQQWHLSRGLKKRQRNHVAILQTATAWIINAETKTVPNPKIECSLKTPSICLHIIQLIGWAYWYSTSTTIISNMGKWRGDWLTRLLFGDSQPTHHLCKCSYTWFWTYIGLKKVLYGINIR